MNVKPGDLITADLFNDIVDEIEDLSDRIAKFLAAVKIDKSGNVGIGTTKPLSKLDVYQGDLHVGAKFGDEDTSSRFIRVETMTPGEPSLMLSRGGNWAAKLLVTETSFRIRDFAGHVDGKDLVTILNTGKVGIGLDATKEQPQGRLTLRGIVEPAQGLLTFFSDTADMEYDGGSDDLFIFKNTKTNGKTAFIGGNVGIGTPSPSAKLHVQSDDDNAQVNIWSTGAARDAVLMFGTATGGQNFYLTLDEEDGRKFKMGTGVADNKLVIQQNGNVGIGMTSPLFKLDVGGNARIEGENPSIRLYGKEDGGRSWMIHELGSVFMIRAWKGSSAGWDIPLRINYDGNVGIGTDPGKDKLAVRGRCYSSGGWHTTNADYAEYLESDNGSVIPVATSVTLTKDGKVRPSKKGEIPIGIITTNSALVGNSYKEWPKKYLRDEFGNLIMEEYREELTVPKKEKVTREHHKLEKKTITEEVTRTEIAFENGKYIQKEISETITREAEEPLFKEVDLYDASGKNVIGKHRIPIMETYEEEIEVLDENGQPVLVETEEFVTKQRPKLNPEYDEAQEYVSREERPEWNCVGLLGQLPLRKGQPVAPTWIKIKDISKKVELWLVR